MNTTDGTLPDASDPLAIAAAAQAALTGDPATGATPSAPAPAEMIDETPAHLLSAGLEMPNAGGSYVRHADGTLTKREDYDA